MSATQTKQTKGPTRKQQASKTPEGSWEAKRTAAAILEVLAGVRTATDAAAALEISAMRYHVLERRALAGLVAGCEPRRKGRTVSPEQEAAHLHKQIKRLEHEILRHQALSRASQRTVGLAPPKPSKKPTGGKKRRKRKPTVRALKLANLLQSDAGVAALERSAIVERVKSGLRRASAEGKQIGAYARPFDEDEAIRLRSQGWGIVRLARHLGIGTGRMAAWLREQEVAAGLTQPERSTESDS